MLTFCLVNIEGGVVAQSPDVSCQVSFDAGCKQIFPKYFFEKMRVLCRIEEGAMKIGKPLVSDFRSFVRVCVLVARGFDRRLRAQGRLPWVSTVTAPGPWSPQMPGYCRSREAGSQTAKVTWSSPPFLIGMVAVATPFCPVCQETSCRGV